MNKWYHGRTIRELTNAKEAAEAEKMGTYYEGEFRDFKASVDLSHVIEYHEAVVTNKGAYNGHPATWVHMINYTSTLLLVPHEKFRAVMEQFDNSADKEGRAMMSFLVGVSEEE